MTMLALVLPNDGLDIPEFLVRKDKPAAPNLGGRE